LQTYELFLQQKHRLKLKFVFFCVMFFVLKMTMLFLSSEQRCQSIFKRIKVMITIITTVLLLIYI